MEVVMLKPGVILISPIRDDENQKIVVVRAQSEKVFYRGVVQSIGILGPQECGFIEGDTVMYTEPLSLTDDQDLVSLSNVVVVFKST
jgi:hypothetical protein